jgi:hypothetical protein
MFMFGDRGGTRQGKAHNAFLALSIKRISIDPRSVLYYYPPFFFICRQLD